ncbi:Gfo/Idh/MocA family protein [Microbacterium sp. NPDC055683]
MTGDRADEPVLRCGLVGTGGVAALHAGAIEHHPRSRLVAVADLSRERAEDFAARWGRPRVHDSLDDLLAGEALDVLIVCTPPGAHREQTLAAFAAGAHVIVEKPAAVSLAELDDMRAAARASGRELAVVFQQRTGTAAAHVRRLLLSGALGRPLVAVCQTHWYRDETYFAAPWRGRWETEGGGTTLGHGIHQIDLLAYLLGDWTGVQGRTWRTVHEIETEDVSTAVVTFANGAVASIVTSAVSPREVSAIRIDTEKATITLEHLNGHGHAEWRVTPAPGVAPAEVAGWEMTGTEVRSDHEPLLHDVFDALLAGQALPSTADEPARSLEIVAAIYASAAAGGVLITPRSLAEHPTHRRRFAGPVFDLRRPGAGGASRGHPQVV